MSRRLSAPPRLQIGRRGLRGEPPVLVEGPLSLAPLWSAPLLVQVHVALGTAAFLVGAVRLLIPCRDPRDRRLGWTFLALLVAAALAAIPLDTPAGSPRLYGVTIGHAFIFVTAIGVVAAFATAGRADTRRWRNVMAALFAGIVFTCGLFELLPGRVMNAVLAGG